MTATIPQLRDAVVAALKAGIPNVNIATHGGTFDEKELAKYGALAPAIRVCVTGVGKAERYNDGRVSLPVQFAAVVLTKDAVVGSQKIERDLAAIGLCGAVQLLLAGNRFGLEGVFQPDDLRARNEYSGPVDTMGIALWQVVWTSGLLVGAPGDESVTQAVAALSQLWINGVSMASGDEIMVAIPTAPEVTPAEVSA